MCSLLYQIPNLFFSYRHAGKPPVRHFCNHSRSDALECSKITEDDLKFFNAKLYEFADKPKQDSFLAKYMSVEKTCRKTVKGRPVQQARTTETKFFFMRATKAVVRVCQSFFLKTLGIGKKRQEKMIQ